VKDSDKQNVLAVARQYAALGFGIVATEGTAAALADGGVEVTRVFKIGAGRPNVLDLVKNGLIQFIINTPSGKIPRKDEVKIRTAALGERIPIMTTLRAASASAKGISSLQKGPMTVKSLQEYHAPRAEN
jgi:carbamoyl-phosphate synthase large subunit